MIISVCLTPTSQYNYQISQWIITFMKLVMNILALEVSSFLYLLISCHQQDLT
jgi:hypothetical protein